MVMDICGVRQLRESRRWCCWQRNIFLAIDKVERLTGIKVPNRQVAILELLDLASVRQMRLAGKPTTGAVISMAPGFGEEIGRIYGFDHLRATLPRNTLLPSQG